MKAYPICPVCTRRCGEVFTCEKRYQGWWVKSFVGWTIWHQCTFCDKIYVAVLDTNDKLVEIRT